VEYTGLVYAQACKNGVVICLIPILLNNYDNFLICAFCFTLSHKYLTFLHHASPQSCRKKAAALKGSVQKKTVVEEDHLTCELSEEEDIAADMGFSDVGKTCEGRPPFLYPAPKFS